MLLYHVSTNNIYCTCCVVGVCRLVHSCTSGHEDPRVAGSRANFYKAVKAFDVDTVEKLTTTDKDLDINAIYDFTSKGEKMSALHYAAFMRKHKVRRRKTM